MTERLNVAARPSPVLEKLTDTLMRTAAEQTGAEHGVLMLARGDKLTIEAVATTGGNTISVWQREAGLAAPPPPQSIIDYVLRTREALVLDDASAEESFLSDRNVLAQTARSIFCVPLMAAGYGSAPTFPTAPRLSSRCRSRRRCRRWK